MEYPAFDTSYCIYQDMVCLNYNRVVNLSRNDGAERSAYLTAHPKYSIQEQLRLTQGEKSLCLPRRPELVTQVSLAFAASIKARAE